MNHFTAVTILLCFVVFVGYAAYVAYPLIRAKRIDATLVKNAKPFSLLDPARSRTILILGDSTAVGVGTAPQESIAALLSKELDTNIENYAVSGAVTKDIVRQAAQAQLPRYYLILIQVGANDVIGFNPLQAAATSLDSTLASLAEKSNHIVVLTSGDIGKAPIFRWPLSLVMSYRTRILRELFIRICARHKAIYVDIFMKPDIISSDRRRYYSPDGLHLNAEGYAYWYVLIRESLLEGRNDVLHMSGLDT